MRYTHPVSTQFFARGFGPYQCTAFTPLSPPQRQYVLRMLVQSPYSRGLCLPLELEWIRPALKEALSWQKSSVGVRHPYVYVTSRCGPVRSTTDDAWHVDGFSTRFTHVPEANYLWVASKNPTQYKHVREKFPNDFNPLTHNVHKYLANRAYKYQTHALESKALYFMDPYVLHRRPPGTTGEERSFLRISLTPIEIPDVNNTVNPLINTTHYVTDGIKDFRDKLSDYDKEKAL